LQGLPAGALAVVGMVGRFPGARNVDEFWRNLCAGKEGVSFFTPEELDPVIPAALRTDPAYVRAKGIVDDCDKFDANFFNIPALEAQVMDPQQRIMLELAWSALEDAGHPPALFPGLIGVYAGMNWNRYREVCLAAHPEVIARFGAFNAALANENDFLATRISYKLNLRGPSVTINAACSTSLVAIAQASQALLNRECDLALAGGISISVPVRSGYLAEDGSMLSPDGHCRPFDARASGTTFNDGAGFVVLRRLEDAVSDHDRIYAVVRGFAVNNDGADKVSFTAPSVSGQAEVVRSALEFAGVDPASIGFIEAHGTATPLGDPIEVAALKQVFGTAQPVGARCILGSVKSSVGHLVHAAGVAGFIKAVLAVRHGRIPPTLFFEQPNPRLGLESSPFRVNPQLEDWPGSGHPRRAGVSAFGVGGTNAHVVVEEFTPRAPASASATPRILCLSAKSEEALAQQTTALQSFLRDDSSGLTLDDVAFTLQRGRDKLPHRAAWAVQSLQDARAALISPQRMASGNGAGTRGVAFMFTGQGAQRARMAEALYLESAVFRQHFDRGAELLRARAGWDVRELLFGESRGSDAEIDETRIAQPALFLVEYSLARTLEQEGLTAGVLLGHSIGEFVAATLAGVFRLEDALHAVVVRGEAMQALPRGSMLTVHCREEEAREFLPADVALAAINAPELCVLSGPERSIDGLGVMLAARGLRSKRLRTSHAFHSAMMDPAVAAVRNALAGMTLSPPQRDLVSTVTGRLLTAEEATSPEYWARQLREPVRFAAALDFVAGRGDFTLVEVGPGSTLTTLALQHPCVERWSPIAALPGSGLAPGAVLEALRAVAHCWALGGAVDWPQTWTGLQPRRASLPTYPFARTRYWLEPAASQPRTQEVKEPAESPTVSPGLAQPQANVKERIIRVIEETTGVDVTGTDPGAAFVELGLDSLSLTQVALQLKRRFKVNVSFRQLMEQCRSLDSLAQHLERELRGGGADPASAPPAPAGADPAADEGAASAKYDVRKAFGAIVRIHTGAAGDLTDRQRARLDAFMRQYVSKTQRSKAYTQAHRPHLADPRVVNGFRPLLKEMVYQLVIERSQGSRVWDLDGNEYVDALNGFGMNMLGWQPPFVVEAVRKQLELGYEIGPQHPLAGEVADLICAMTGNERAGLCNTGSEAVMGAVRIARTVTGRAKIAIFSGSYHGIFDEVIVRGTKKLRSFPAAPGIMPNTADNVLVLEYGTDESLAILRDHAAEIAAVLVEPVQSRRPDFQPRAFLHQLRELTERSGSLLILDEIVTGFRCHPGGIQALFDLRADLCTYGKVVGGGFPIGVIAGRRAYMDALDGGGWQYGDDSIPTVGVTYFAGTFVRHPLALAAAKAVLQHLQQSGPELQAELNRSTAEFAADLNAFCQESGAPVAIKSFSSVWKIVFTEDHPLQDLLFAMMRSRGVHILDNFPCFFTTAHSPEDRKFMANAFKASVWELQESDFLPRRKEMPELQFDAAHPPIPGARLGRAPDGQPAWFVPNPDQPGKFLRYQS
jgi:acyl transferase domain-containing protein